MTTQELYDLVQKGFDELEGRLTSIDSDVEASIAELKGKKIEFVTVKDIIISISALGAIAV